MLVTYVIAQSQTLTHFYILILFFFFDFFLLGLLSLWEL